MKYSSRFFLYAPLALFLTLAGGAMAHWWVIASAVDKKLSALNGHEAIPGITISYASKTISGFPFNVDVVFTGFRISGAGAHGPFSWTTERFALHRLTYGRTQDIYEAAGQQHLSWTDASGKTYGITFLSGSLRASAITSTDGLARFDLDAIAVSGAQDIGRKFKVGRLQFHLRRDPDGSDLDLMESADAVAIDGVHINPRIKSLQTYSVLTQLPVIVPLLRGEQSWPQTLVQWRARGGGNKIDAAKMTVPPERQTSDRLDRPATLLGLLY